MVGFSSNRFSNDIFSSDMVTCTFTPFTTSVYDGLMDWAMEEKDENKAIRIFKVLRKLNKR
jgi:hypothetical protein